MHSSHLEHCVYTREFGLEVGGRGSFEAEESHLMFWGTHFRFALHAAVAAHSKAFEKTIKPGLEAVQILKDEGQGDVVAVDA